MRIVFLSLVVLFIGCSSPQPVRTNIYLLNDKKIEVIKHIGSVNSDILFFNLHENESTSIEALKSYSSEFKINYIYLKHTGERRISFNEAGMLFSIDPNRIFTQKGRKETLKKGGNYSRRAGFLVEEFSGFLLDKLKNYTFIIAMHNNTPDEYSIKSYLPNGSEAKNTDQVYINPEMDPDDFIYTTDKGLYQKLKEEKINVILQDNSNFIDDGSLSVYCGQKKIKYVNIETEQGHLKEQLRLMKLILSLNE